MTYHKIIDNNFNALIKDIQTLVRIKSVTSPPVEDAPFGKGILDALNFVLSLGKEMGFAVKNVDNYAGHIEWGQGDEILGILGHLDVVPEGKGWTHDPYEAVIEDGQLYGRGVLDDKAPIISCLYALKALKDSGIQPKKKIRLILGTDEETQWRGISHYLKKEESPDIAFTPDGDFPVLHGEMGIILCDWNASFATTIDDGGLVILSVTGGEAPNMVPGWAQARIYGKKPVTPLLEAYNKDHGTQLSMTKSDNIYTITALGQSAHGSTPEKGENAISHLMNFLNVLDLQIGDATNFVRHYARKIGLDYNGTNLNLDLEDSYGKLVFNVGRIEMNQSRAKICINIRYPITLDEDSVYTPMESALKETGISILKRTHMPPIYLPKDHPLISILMETYKDVTGDVTPPLTTGGGTYARAMKNAVAFGPLFPDEIDTAHQKDERLKLDSIRLMTHIYAQAIEKLMA